MKRRKHGVGGAPPAMAAALALLALSACNGMGGGSPGAVPTITPKATGACLPGDPGCKRLEQGKSFPVEAIAIQDKFRDIIRLTTPKYEMPDGRPTVMVFPHKAHATERLKKLSATCKDFPDVSECTSCHHMDVEKDAPRKCSECHPKEPAAGAPPTLELALHTRCIGCHKLVDEKCADLQLRTATDCEQCHRAPSTKKTVVKLEGPATGAAPPAPGAMAPATATP